MALMGDLFDDNILNEPDLETILEGEENEEPAHSNQNEGDEEEDENKENSAGSQDVIKKRQTSQKPKLNILRLMNKNGLTAIENYFKDVNFKGKGHEREDLNLIMRKLEIWAHQLYPALQFDDCLAKLEKLGTNKSVMVYVKKIRLGMEEDMPRDDENIDMMNKVDDDDEDETQPSLAKNDIFDQLINKQKQQNNSTGPIAPSGLTAEQRERMLRNRLIAEQRRMARLKARNEQQRQENNSNQESVKLDGELANSEISNTISENNTVSIELSESNIIDTNISLESSGKSLEKSNSAELTNISINMDYSDIVDLKKSNSASENSITESTEKSEQNFLKVTRPLLSSEILDFDNHLINIDNASVNAICENSIFKSSDSVNTLSVEQETPTGNEPELMEYEETL